MTLSPELITANMPIVIIVVSPPSIILRLLLSQAIYIPKSTAFTVNIIAIVQK